MARGFADKVAVVTGASSGVGRAIVRALAARGAKLVLIARGRDALESTAREVRAAGGEVLTLTADVADPDAVGRAAERVIRVWGHIDVWINSAAVAVLAPAWQMTPDEHRRVLEVDYLGTVYGTLAALKHMRPRNRGVIVQLGGTAAYRSPPLQSAHAASKAAVRAFTSALRSELLREGSKVRVSMLQLPAVNTPLFGVMRNRLPRHAHPLPPVYQPEVIARAVLYAIEHPPREMCIGWSTVLAILGQRLWPRLSDRSLRRRAWDGQQTDRLPPTYIDNIDAPLPGDRGAHGPFDDEARGSSVQLWLRTHPVLLGLVLGVLALLAALARTVSARGW